MVRPSLQTDVIRKRSLFQKGGTFLILIKYYKDKIIYCALTCTDEFLLIIYYIKYINY